MVADKRRQSAGPTAYVWLMLGLLWWSLCTALALWQDPGPITTLAPVTVQERGWMEALRYPVERNAYRRLPSLGNQAFNALHFSADGQRGWVVGEKGTVLATRDGGKSWLPQASGTAQGLFAVHFSDDGQRGWVAGSEGTVLATRDGGSSWQPQASGTTQGLKAIHFSADGQRGWVVGDEGTVLATRDGGIRWQLQASGTTQGLFAVHFSADGQRGWVVGDDGAALTTGDSGDSWQQQAFGTLRWFRGVHFSADDQRGWVVGSGGIALATRDGGRTWQLQVSGVTRSLNAVHFSADGQRGWVVGDGGTVLTTRDGGSSWQPQASGTTRSLVAVHFSADDQRGWVVGDDGVALATRDGGSSWQLQTSGLTRPLFAVHFSADGQRGWAVGGGGTVLATRDGGRSWLAQASGTKASLSAVHFSAEGQRGWVVGSGGMVLATRDGGSNWQVQASGTKEWLYAVHFSTDSQYGWLVGDEGTVLATRDGGSSWQSQASGSTRPLHGVHFSADGQRGWLVGSWGTLLTTRDGGSSWQPQTSGTTEPLSAVHFSADGQRGWVTGFGGTVLATRDGGSNWRPQASRTTQRLRAVHFNGDGQRGWAAGDGGAVLATRDGGSNWQPQASGTTQGLGAVQFSADGQRGWAVGSGGTVLATQDGGSTWRDPRDYRRYPAPWYWLSYLPLLAVPALARRAWLRRQSSAGGVADMPATDAALERPEQDRLNFLPLARGISRFLRNPATEPPLTLAITGDWGTGKSSLMGLLCADLRAHGLRPVWFNAWHHQKEDHLFAALLGALSQQAAPPWASLDGLSFRLRLLWLRSRKHWLLSLALVALVSAMLALHLGFADPAQETAFWQAQTQRVQAWAGVAPKDVTPVQPSAAAASSAAGAASAVATEGAKDGRAEWARGLAWLSSLLPLLLALRAALKQFGIDPAALLASGAQTLKPGQAAELNSFRMRFAKEFKEVTEALPERLVIVVDDLDRCRPEAVLDIMEAVNFLTSSGQCFVIFGMATERVQAALAVAFERIAREMAAQDLDAQGDQDKDRVERERRRRYAENYLHKLVNLEIKVPTTQDFEAWRLLAEPDEQAPEPRRRQLLATLRRALMPALVVFAASVGALAGLAWVPEQAPSLAAPAVAAATPATPVAPPASSALAAKPATSAAKVPEPAAAMAPVGVQPGQTSHADRWLVAAVVPVLLAGAALMLWQTARRLHRQAHDSQEFRDALKLWSQLVRDKQGTPRAIKRFGNKLRYFEMLQQGQERDPSLWEAWLARWRRPRSPANSAEAAAPAETSGRLAAPQLVALGAMYEAFGAAWLSRLQQDGGYGAFEFGRGLVEQEALGGRAIELMRAHQERFQTVWPPTAAEVEVFSRLLAGIRMPGDVQELPMREAMPESAASASEGASPA